MSNPRRLLRAFLLSSVCAALPIQGGCAAPGLTVMRGFAVVAVGVGQAPDLIDGQLAVCESIVAGHVQARDLAAAERTQATCKATTARANTVARDARITIVAALPALKEIETTGGTSGGLDLAGWMSRVNHIATELTEAIAEIGSVK